MCGRVQGEVQLVSLISCWIGYVRAREALSFQMQLRTVSVETHAIHAGLIIRANSIHSSMNILQNPQVLGTSLSI